jgi:DNA polymerase III subunit chi
MTEIRFYHLERQGLEQVLPSILAKALERGSRVIVKTADEKEAERLNEFLWTYNPDSFLPHGTKKDGFTDQQPVILTSADENPNGADVLILTQGTQSAMQGDFKLCCEMLDGRNENEVAGARARWKTYKDAGFEVTYWQQGDKGWEKKAA